MRKFIFCLLFLANIIHLKAQSEVYQTLDTLNQEYVIKHTALFSDCNISPVNMALPMVNNSEWSSQVYYSFLTVSPNWPCTRFDTIHTGIQFDNSGGINTFITHCNIIGPFITDTTFNTSIDTLYINTLSANKISNKVKISINNPVQDYIEFFIEKDTDLPEKVEIWNGLGQHVLSLPFQKTIDVQFLNRGFYFIRIDQQSVKFYKE